MANNNMMFFQFDRNRRFDLGSVAGRDIALTVVAGIPI